MAVSEKTRKEVKARANGCCQLLHRTEYRGEDGTPMDIIHRHHSGMGGQSSEHWTNDKKNLLYGCRRCHDLLHHPTKALKIVDMDPDHEEESVSVGIDGERIVTMVPYPVLKIVDHNGIEIPQRNIWLFARLIKAQLGQLLTSVRGDRMFESDRANAMLQLYDDFDLITPDAVSPEQMLAAEGFDSEVALKQVQAAAWIEQHELDWPRGLVVSKVSKFRSAAQKRLWQICDKKLVQSLLNAAVSQSKSDISETFAELGITIRQPRMYIVLWGSGEITLARITDIEKLKERVAGRFSPASEQNPKKIGLLPMIISAQKFAVGFSVRRGKLNYSIRDQLGNEIPFLDDDDLDKEVLPVALWLGKSPE